MGIKVKVFFVYVNLSLFYGDKGNGRVYSNEYVNKVVGCIY